MNIFTYFPDKKKMNSITKKIYKFNSIQNTIFLLNDEEISKYKITNNFYSLNLDLKLFLIKFIITSLKGGFFFDISSVLIKNLQNLYNEIINNDIDLYFDNKNFRGFIFMNKNEDIFLKINNIIDNFKDNEKIKNKVMQLIKNTYTKNKIMENNLSNLLVNDKYQLCKKKIIFKNFFSLKNKFYSILEKKNFFYLKLSNIYKIKNEFENFLLNDKNSLLNYLLIKKTHKPIISIMTNIKDELDLKEWICYYIYILKFDYIFIYDNDSHYSIKELVNQNFQDVIEKIYVIFMPGPQVKPRARLHYKQYFLHLSDWTLFIDGDEYLCLKQDNIIHNFIKKPIFSNVEQIAFNWLVMSTDGNLFRDENKLLIERFTNGYKFHKFNNLVKVLVRNNSIKKNNYTHPHFLITKKNYIVDALGNKMKLSSRNIFLLEYLNNSFIAHYHYKSKEDWIHKCNVVKNNGGRDDIKSLLFKKYSIWPSEYGEIEVSFLKDNYTTKLRELIFDKKISENNNIYLSKREAIDKLKNIHSKLKINYGSFKNEYPEQIMAVRYLKGKEKVLEIGGNIGRNSMVIASIIDNKNLVVLESDTGISKKLIENRDLNNMNFYIENSALSKRKLIQCKWDTKPSDKLEPGFSWVNTITLNKLKRKYAINFDTLVLDCEGAFYYILMDMPKILNNINLIIMENDYHILEQKKYIDSVLKKNNFYVIYTLNGGWGPCYNNFFEVWKKKYISFKN